MFIWLASLFSSSFFLYYYNYYIPQALQIKSHEYREELKKLHSQKTKETLELIFKSPFLYNIDQFKQEIINEYGANTLLELALKAYPIDLLNNIFEKQQAEIIKFSINTGATYLFDIRRNFNSVPLKTLEYLKTLVNNDSFPASSFLKQVIISYKYDQNYKLSDSDKEILFYDLVKFSIEQNADVNTIVIDNFPILQFVESSKVFKLLEDNGAKCALFTQNLKKIIDTINITESDIKNFSKKLHNSLIENKKTYTEIPKLVHHIWLTSASNSKEINSDDLNNIIKTKAFFAEKMSGSWNQIIWVNNKDLIPKSIKFLEDNNIEVRSIDNYSAYISLFDQIQQSIAQGKLVMAADMLRYSVMELLGGVYADLNYEFLNEFNFETNKYDFFINSLVNSFFMAKSNHPIIKAEIEFLKKLFSDEFVNLLWLKDYLNTKEQTMFTTAYTFAYNIIKHINKEGNIDFANPSNSNLTFDGFTCNVGLEAYKYTNLMEYCSNPLTVTGIDQHSDWNA